MKVDGRSDGRAARLCEALLRDISSGRYPQGGFLPAENCLAESYSVSRTTVRRVVDILVQEKRLEKLPYRGIRVSVVDDESCRPGASSSAMRQLAFITPSHSGETDLYIRGMNRAIDRERFSVATYATHADLDQYRRIIESIMCTRPAGVILHTVSSAVFPLDAERLAQWDIPIVTVGSDAVSGLNCDRVEEFYGTSIAIASKWILRKGYRDIVYFASEPRSDSMESIEMLRERLGEAGISLPDDRLEFYPAPHGYAADADPYIDARNYMLRRLDEGFRCELLVAGHDFPAVAALQAFMRKGIAVPDQIKVMSTMRCSVQGVSPMTLTTLDYDREEQGRVAMQLLMRRIDGYAGPIEVIRMAGQLVEGETG